MLGVLVAQGATDWPRVFVRDGAMNTLYQPQLEYWDYKTLKALSVVAIQKTGAAQQTFGTIRFEADTRIDRAERWVFLEQLRITEGEFPSAGAEGDNYLKSLRSLLPKEAKPRIRTLAPAPGWPLPLTVTPAARPCNWACRLAAGVCSSSVGFTTDTEPMISRFFSVV